MLPLDTITLIMFAMSAVAVAIGFLGDRRNRSTNLLAALGAIAAAIVVCAGGALLLGAALLGH